MLTFYFSKGSSALAAHILLLETGLIHDAVEVSIPKGEHQTPAFLARHPKGRIPVLETPEGKLTENPAILEYIAATDPGGRYLPEGVWAEAQARSTAAYLCATAHVAFAHKQRGRRWAQSDAALADMAAQVATNLTDCATFLERDLALDPWAMGDGYSFVDPYVFLLGRWMAAAGVSLGDTPGLQAHRDAMLARAATQEAMKLHGLD